jgi:type IV secretory pathway TrbD component
VDRELGMTALLISAITAIGGYNLVAIIAAVIFWFASMHYLRKWTKQDPQIRDVFLRHIKYAKDQTVLFLAHPGVFCPARLNHWNKR